MTYTTPKILSLEEFISQYGGNNQQQYRLEEEIYSPLLPDLKLSLREILPR